MKPLGILVIALSLGLTGLSGCKDRSTPPAAPAGEASVAFDSPPAAGAKATCPVMGNTFTVTEETLTSEHEGKHYAFCCPACKPQFDADPEKYVPR